MLKRIQYPVFGQRFLTILLGVSSFTGLGFIGQTVDAQIAVPTRDDHEFQSLSSQNSLLQIPLLEESIQTTSSQFDRLNQLSQESYILGPGDLLNLQVFGYSEYTGQPVILPDGTISLPVLGEVRAAGFTLTQFRSILQNELNRILVKPRVTLSLLRLRPLTISVAGEVQRPGPIQLQGIAPGTEGNREQSPRIPTVSEAIAQAGGITHQADLRHVILRRVTHQGAQEIALNFWEALRSEGTHPDLLLRDGDSIYIPKATQEISVERQLLARSRFAPETVKVRVVGEVKRPGEVEISPNSSLSSTVAIAGGPTDKASLRNVSLVRLNENGTVNTQTVNLQHLSDAIQVQEGDVIFVPKSKGDNILDVAASIFSPLGSLINLIRLF